MAKKITRKDIIEENILSEHIKQAEELLKIYIKLGDEFKETASIAKNELDKANTNNAKGIREVNAEVANSIKLRKADEDIKIKAAKVEKELVKILEAELKAEQQLNKTLIESEKTKQAIIKTQEVEAKQSKRIQQDREKQIKKQISLEKKELDAYQKKSKKLNELRKRFKALSITEGKSSKATKKLGKEVKKLDKELKEVDEAAGQFQRNVGNYPDILGKAAQSILGVAAAAATAAGAFEGVKGSLEDTAEGSENVREITSILGGVWDQVTNTVSAAALDVIDYGTAVSESINSGEGLIDSLTGQENQFNRTSEATTDFIGKTKESIDGQVELTKRMIAFEKAVRPLELRITNLNGLIEEQSVIAGDSTRSFGELENAVLESQLLQIERAKINITIAKEELSIVQEQIRLKNLAGGAGVSLLDSETAALNKLSDARSDLNIEILENEKELNQIKQDRLERDLDILIDGFDNQKTINERIIANEKETLKKRSDLLIKTNQLANDSFREQKKVLEELSNANIDVDELLLLDATQLQKQIRLLEQSEIIEGRTLEVVRERRIVLQDLEDAQNDLNDSMQESIDLESDIIAQEKALNSLLIGSEEEKNNALSELDLEREQKEIESLKRRIELSKDGSVEELRLEKELNDALLNQQERLLQEEKDLKDKADEEDKKREEERLQRQKDNFQTLTDLLDLTLQNQGNKFNNQIKESENSILESQSAVDNLQEQANLGNLDAQSSIKAEKQKIANEKENIDALEKKRRNLQILVTGLAVANEKVQNGDGNALANAGSDMANFISNLKGFYTGTETTLGADLGNAYAITGDRDTHIIKAHKDEHIIGVENSRKLGGMNQNDIVQGALMLKNGEFVGRRAINAVNQVDVFNDSRMISAMSDVKLAIDNIKIPEHRFNYDAVNKIATESVRIGNITTNNHKKIGGIFS